MLMIASNKAVKEDLVTTDEYIRRRFNYEKLVKRGEPYVYGTKVPMIFELGNKTYWKMHANFEVYGEGIDPEVYDEIEDVLIWRRRGHVYGRWYSKYVPDGEVGYQFHGNLVPVSYVEFTFFVNRIEKK